MGRTLRGAAFLAILCVGTTGCGTSPELAAVEGVVTLDGQPLPDVEVVFLPDPDRGTLGREMAAYSGADGRYRIPLDRTEGVGVVVGVHRVCVRDARMYLVPPGGGLDPETGEPTAAKANAGRKTSRVPLAYGDARQTPLRDVAIEPGTQTFDIELGRK